MVGRQKRLMNRGMVCSRVAENPDQLGEAHFPLGTHVIRQIRFHQDQERRFCEKISHGPSCRFCWLACGPGGKLSHDMEMVSPISNRWGLLRAHFLIFLSCRLLVPELCAAVPGPLPDYEPTGESLRQHPVPDWFKDAKLGVLIHLGPYSIPAWAPRTGEVAEEVARAGWESWFTRHPASEFYLNSLRIPGSPVAKFHAETFGRGFDYSDFASKLVEASRGFKPEALTRWLGAAGFRYLIFTAKHHDGHLMWPGVWTGRDRTIKPSASEHDFVSDWAEATRSSGMKFGVYYSSGLDWSFTENPITNAAGLFISTPAQTNYLTSVDRHWRDLVQRVKPDILWNDLGVPQDFRTEALIADYYNRVPGGIVNDRFSLGLYPGVQKAHADFRTPPVADSDRQQGRYFEVMRPLGKSCGFQPGEADQDLIPFSDLVRTLVDVTSRNGRLLLALGPSPAGEIAAPHRKWLDQLGAWMKIHGEGLHGTRPWNIPALRSPEGVEMRFAARSTQLYVHCFPSAESRRITISPLRLMPETRMTFLGQEDSVKWKTDGQRTIVDLPDFPANTPVLTLRITPQPVWMQPP